MRRDNSKTSVQSDQALSWAQFWAWFGSDAISDKERKETFLFFVNARVFSSMPEDAQIEVLEYAPKYVREYFFRVGQINDRVLSRLNNMRPPDVDAPANRAITYKEIVSEYKK